MRHNYLFFSLMFFLLWGVSIFAKELTFSGYEKNTFTIPISTSVNKDELTSKKILSFCDWLSLKDKGESLLQKTLGSQNIYPVDTPISYYQYRDFFMYCNYYRLCFLTKNTKANLTAILLFTSYAIKNKQVKNPTFQNSLATIEDQFKETWQARITPVFEAVLMKKANNSIKGTKKAIKYLEQKVPNKEIQISQNVNNQILQKLNIERSVRLTFLKTTALMQYNAGSNTQYSSKDNINFLVACSKTCKKIIMLYPNTEISKWAKDILERRIPVIKEMLNDTLK